MLALPIWTQSYNLQVFRGWSAACCCEILSWSSYTPVALAPRYCYTSGHSLHSPFLELREAVATPTPETFWELLALDPDLAKMLKAVILSQANHAPASYNFNKDVIYGGKGCL
jgi:hypothetical protein